MVDRRARRGFPERWLLPPAPQEQPAADRWAHLPFERRRALARVRPDDVADLPEDDREVVAALQRARLATRWRLLAAAPVFGLLMLMTVWGFGRSTYPDRAQLWLFIGLTLGAAAWFVAALAAAARLRRARSTLRAAERHVEDDHPDDAPPTETPEPGGDDPDG